MKSSIKFINDDKDSRVKKEVLELIKERTNNDKGFYPLHLYYDLLIKSKYIIEENNLNVSSILDGDIDELVNKLKEKNVLDSKLYNLMLKKFVDNKIYEFIKKIIYEDYEIVCFNDRVFNALIDSNKKYIVVCNENIGFINNPNVDVFMYGASLYKYESAKMYDEIVGFNRNIFIDEKDINYDDYEKIIFINTKHNSSNNIVIKKEFADYDKLIMICNYSDISKYKDGLLNIKSILMDKDKAYIEYKLIKGKEKPNDKDSLICIKELSNVNDDDLKKEIKNNKEKENICLYASVLDIKLNSRRLGFNAYKKEYNVDRTKVLRLIDYNEKLTRDIDELNKEIATQIDKLVVR